MSTKPQRPRPREDRARQIAAAACKIIETSGKPVPGRPGQQDHLGVFSVCKTVREPGSFVIDVWPVPWGRKLFSCEVELRGQVSLRSFRRGAWEDQFLSYADSVVKHAGVQHGHEVVGVPTGGGKVGVMQPPEPPQLTPDQGQ